MSDIEIARKANKKNIKDIASTLNLDEKVLHPFGHYIAKIDTEANNIISKKMSFENTIENVICKIEKCIFFICGILIYIYNF